MLYATPDELEALSMGQRIGVMRDGRMVQVGTPDELFERPGDAFVAEQVGSPRMNLVAGRPAAATARRVRLPFGEVAGGPWAPALRRFPVGTPVLFGVRPHDLRPGRRASARPALRRRGCT